MIGVGAVIAMVTLGSGATKSVTSDIASMGRNLLIVTPGQRRPGTLIAASPFSIEDANAIARDISGLAAVAPAVSRSAVAVLGNHNHTTQITGATNAFFAARDWGLALGRGFTVAEDRAGLSEQFDRLRKFIGKSDLVFVDEPSSLESSSSLRHATNSLPVR